MYRTCLFCNQDLGANEVVEPFPVGRRLAFDQARGRLWVICRKCEKWNLTPFDERWEAIEECERRFHDARKRVASDNIGLARLAEGLELVRIGEPLRPEFAAWRYGDQFGRRRRRAIATTTGAAVVGAGIVIAGAWTGVLGGGTYWVWQLADGAVKEARKRRVVARVAGPGDLRFVVRGRHLDKSRLLAPVDEAEGPRLLLPHEGGQTILAGHRARQAAALLMPKVNRGGASKWRVQRAVARLEAARDPDLFLRSVAGTPYKKGVRGVDRDVIYLPKMNEEVRLAIEMAVNEENERNALAGELELLELEWKEAEEIAAIADRLGIPENVERQLEELRRRAAPGPMG